LFKTGFSKPANPGFSGANMAKAKAAKPNLIATDASAVLQLASQDLACFMTAIMPGFQLARHTEFLIGKLEEIERNQRLPRRLVSRPARLCLSTPPQHGKSSLLAHFAGWYAGRRAGRAAIAYVTYGQELSDIAGRAVRSIVTEPTFETVFPSCRLVSDSGGSQRRLEFQGGGTFYAVGVGGPLTGRNADCLIVDDAIKDAESARSDAIRKALHEWFRSVAFTRLKPRGAVIVCGTRWSEDDLTGYLLREHASEGWELINLPAIAEPGDLLGRVEGEALWPQRYDREQLDSFRRQLTAGPFVTLYQGHPAASSGALFQRSWFRTYSGPLPSFQMIVMSADTAYKTGKQNDYSVTTVWGKCNNGCYLLSLWRAKVEYHQLRFQLIQQAEQWKPHAILLEDASSGQSLIQELRAATPYPVIAVKVDKDKRSRAVAVTPQFEASRVFFPADAPWLPELEDELAVFDHGVRDDQVDSCVMALNYCRQASNDSANPILVSHERSSPLQWLRNALSRPAPRREQSQFWEHSPPLPFSQPNISPLAQQAAKKVVDGQPLSDAEEWALLLRGLDDGSE
jgi:predicted phage terminase large subunit-like protein